MSYLNKTEIAIIVAIVVGVISISGLYLYPAQTVLSQIPETEEDKRQNDALGVAQKFVLVSPTFAFDGSVNSLDLLSIDLIESSPPQYMFRMAFDSTNTGYGNREGQTIDSKVTPHTIEIIVSEGMVLSAVTDDTWDELNHQHVIKNPKLKSTNEPLDDFNGKVIDYQSLFSALKSRGLDVVLIEENDDSMFSVPAKVISVSGIPIQVYEFASESAVISSKEIISEDGTEIGLNSIRWMDTPHFYSQGRIIVQYIGHDPEILTLLEFFLGNQFAGM